MGDNSVDWMSVLKAVSDNELYMNILFGDMNVENPQEMEKNVKINQAANPEEMVPDQDTNLTLAEPLKNHKVPESGPSSSSSIVFQESTSTVQNKMINGGSLLNPLGFPYQPVVQPPPSAAVESENGGQSSSSQGLPQSTDGGEKKLIVYRKRGRKKKQEAGEAGDAEQRKELTKIKNRITAARSRAKKQEHTKFLEEKVEELRNENDHIKKLLTMMEKDVETKKQDMAKKAALKRTSSSEFDIKESKCTYLD